MAYISAENRVKLDDVATFFSSSRIGRRKPNLPITESDIENLVVEALWKIFDKFRPQAAQRLGIKEIDLALVDAKITGVKIDGSRVINPEGFSGKFVEFSFIISVANKGASSKQTKEIEKGSLKAHLLKEESTKNLVYAEISEGSLKICEANESETACLAEFNSGTLDIIRKIAEEFMVEDSIAEKIYQRFLDGSVGESVSQKINKTLKMFLGAIVEKSDGIIKKNSVSSDTFFIDSPRLPTYMSGNRFQFNGRRVKICIVDSKPSAENLFKKVEAYMPLSEIAQKRLSWLASRV